MRIEKQAHYNLIVFLLAIAFFIYTSLRAYFLSFTYDESWSFLNIYEFKLWDILDHSNTHPINSILMLISYKLLGNNELILRIPNLLAHLTFMFFSFLILRKLNPVFMIFGFIFINGNPFMLDFFSLARGYGLSLAFMMGSLYFITVTVEKPVFKFKYIFLSTFLASLSVLSNYTLLNYYLSLTILILLIIYFNYDLRKLQTYKILFFELRYTIIYNFLFLIFLLGILVRLRSSGQLYFGGTSGFIKDTVFSLIRTTFYFEDYPYIIYYIIFSIILGVLLFSIYSSIDYFNINKNIDKKMVVLIILLLCILGPLVQHYLLKTPFLVERTALLYIPLFSLVFVFYFHDAGNRIKKFRFLSLFIIIGMCTTMIFHLIKVMNVDYCYSWKYNANAKKVIQVISMSNSQQNKLKLGISWVFNRTLHYYKFKDKMDWLEIILIDKPWEHEFDLQELSPSYYNKKFQHSESEYFNPIELKKIEYLYVLQYKNIDFNALSQNRNIECYEETKTCLIKNLASF